MNVVPGNNNFVEISHIVVHNIMTFFLIPKSQILWGKVSRWCSQSGLISLMYGLKVFIPISGLKIFLSGQRIHISCLVWSFLSSLCPCLIWRCFSKSVLVWSENVHVPSGLKMFMALSNATLFVSLFGLQDVSYTIAVGKLLYSVLIGPVDYISRAF